MNLDDLDRALLDRIQRDFPIEPRPFDVLARELGTDEATVMNQVRQLQSGGVVRQIGPVFDLHRLGYTSTLCAAKVAPEAVDAVAERINAYPEVTHNYLRDAQFNMWFTLVAPSQQRMDEIRQQIRSLPGINDVISLPADRTFKINVHFVLNRDSHHLFEAPAEINGDCPYLNYLNDRDVDVTLIRALQASLPIIERPYLEIAKQAGMTEDEVISHVREWLDAGVIRRFGARVKHHAIGYTANGMSVWDVPPDQVEAAGQYIASLPEVSHCYTRPRFPQFDYNLYAMIHGKEEQEVRRIAFDIAAHLHLTSYEVLFSTRELKKSAPKFFSRTNTD